MSEQQEVQTFIECLLHDNAVLRARVKELEELLHRANSRTPPLMKQQESDSDS